MCTLGCTARVRWFILTQDSSPALRSPGQLGHESCCRSSASSISGGIQQAGLLLVLLEGCARQGSHRKQAGAGGAAGGGAVMVATLMLLRACTSGAWEGWMGWRAPCSAGMGGVLPCRVLQKLVGDEKQRGSALARLRLRFPL